MKNQYIVSVLFVNYEDFWSKVVYYILGRGYSHAAISVDDAGETYYSFNFKGFRRERPRKHEAIVSKSICYKLSVSKQEYDRISEMIEEFQSKRFEWRYNLIGLLLSRIHISHRRHKYYYCSEFVAEMLERAKVYRFERSVAHYLPNRLEREIQTFRNLSQIIHNPIQRRCY
jgi:inositol transport system substrate-binding protein